MLMAVSRFHLDARQGADEQRTEAYLRYCEGAAQTATQYGAKKNSSMPSFARFAGIQMKAG
jgi:hypothetical protein